MEKQKLVGDYSYFDGSTFFYFGYYGEGTKYVSDLTLPFDAIRTHPRGLARDGTVTGHFKDSSDGNRERGFALKDGIATTYDYPDENAFTTEFEGINKKGLIAGEWLDDLETFSRAFLFNSRRGKFLAIDVPGSTYAFADGVNDAGIAAVSGDTTSYIYCPSRKTCPLSAAIEIPDHRIPGSRNVGDPPMRTQLPRADACSRGAQIYRCRGAARDHRARSGFAARAAPAVPAIGGRRSAGIYQHPRVNGGLPCYRSGCCWRSGGGRGAAGWPLVG
jgi:hypothetical protein